MKHNDLGELLLLSALWGASFLFMRITAPEFGPLAMAALRVAGAAAFLLPLLLLQQQQRQRQAPNRGWAGAMVQHWRPLLVVGITNSALPFTLFGYASLHLTGGLAAIFNASTPLFGALIASTWLRERLDGWRVAGLAIGFFGVAALASMRSGGAGAGGPPLAVAACLAAPLLYGFSACYAKRRLAAVPSLVVATGSQTSAALALALPAALAWPATAPAAHAWLMLALLAVLSTGVAYILYFRLIAHAGASYAMTVTYLVPPFAVVWGALFLGERVTPPMVAGCAVILAGTALATGLLPRRSAVQR